MKKYVGDPLGAIMPLPPILHGCMIPTPSTVVRACLNKGQWQILVQWEGRPVADATWEPVHDFKKCYPTF